MSKIFPYQFTQSSQICQNHFQVIDYQIIILESQYQPQLLYKHLLYLRNSIVTDYRGVQSRRVRRRSCAPGWLF